MKKLFVILLFSPIFVTAQKSFLDSVAEKNLKKIFAKPTYFVWLDFQQDFKGHDGEKLEKQSSNVPWYFWGSCNNNRGPMGIAINFYTDGDGGKGATIGPTYNVTGPKDTYWEFNLSPGIEWPRTPTIDDPVKFTTSSYVYLETKSEERIANGKMIGVLSAMWYPTLKQVWYQGYAVWMPIRCIGLGGFIESDGSIGPRVQANIKVTDKGVLSLWTAGGAKETLTLGANISFQF